MEPLTPAAIRSSFVNATRGEVSRLHLPDDLDAWDDAAWARLDFLGWVDPRAPQSAAVVVPGPTGPVGVRLRRNGGGGGRTKMCSLCCTVHPSSGVALMVANRAGKAGRDGNSVGVDVCADLRCSGYVRGWLAPPAISPVAETTSVEDRVARLHLNLDTFLRRVRR